ncbi:hypothetical protein [Micromonospora sp. LOL_023]
MAVAPASTSPGSAPSAHNTQVGTGSSGPRRPSTVGTAPSWQL